MTLRILIVFFLLTSLLNYGDRFVPVPFSPVVTASLWDIPLLKKFTTSSKSTTHPKNEVPSNPMPAPSRTTFRCQRPFSSFDPHLKPVRGSADRASQVSGSDKKLSSSASSPTCDFTYFKVVNAKVEVSNCTGRERDLPLKNSEEIITVVNLPPRNALVSTIDGDENEHENEEGAPKTNTNTPRHPTMVHTDRASLADVPTAKDDSCTATVFLDFEASPQLQLLLAHQYTNSTYGPLKMGENEEEGRMVEEALDVWRYSLTLFHVTEKGEIQYKGYDQNGYSMCCDLLRHSSLASSHSSSSFCSWHSSSSTNADKDAEGTGEKEEDENAERDAPLSHTRYVHMDQCPLPQIPSNTSSSHGVDATPFSFSGRISKPLPALISGEWLAKIQLWRTRYGAWEQKRNADAAQTRILSSSSSSSATGILHAGATEEEGEGNEVAVQENALRHPPPTHDRANLRNAPSKRLANKRGEGKPFMNDEENVELLGRVVISFHVDENISNKKETKRTSQRGEEDSHEEPIKDEEFSRNDEKNEKADTPQSEAREEGTPTSLPKTIEKEAEPPRETDL